MSIKIENNEVVKAFKKLGLTPLEKYSKHENKIKCVDKDGWMYAFTFYDVKTNHVSASNRFGVKNPYSMYNYNKYMKDYVLNGTELLDTEPKYDLEKSHFKCGDCGKEFYQLWKVFTVDNPHHCCQDCANNVYGGKKRLSMKVVESRIEKSGFIWVDKKYDGNHKNVLVKDKNGYLGEIVFASLMSENKFPIFSPCNEYWKENIKNYCLKNNIKVRLVTQDWADRESPLNFRCKCGRIFSATIDVFLQGKHECDICTKRKSKNELAVEEWLQSKKVDYVCQYRFDNFKTFPFDFYIEGYGVIEVDGEHHFQPVRFNGISLDLAEKNFEKTCRRDKLKNEYCEKENIKLLRISYKDIRDKNYINILTKEFEEA